MDERKAATIASGVAGFALAAAVSSGLTQPVTALSLAGMTLDEPPPGFDAGRTGNGGAAQWRVIADATAIEGRAIEQTTADTADYRFPLAIYKGLTLIDGEVTLRFKPVAGRVDQAGGIAIRLSDPNNYYVVRANALEDNVRFYRVVNGRREQLAGVNTKVTPNEWHQLGIAAKGDSFAITFDGKPVFTARDGTFARGGNVALWTKSDSITRFDSISIMPRP